MAYYDALIAKWGTLSGNTAAKLAAVNALTVPAPAQPVVVESWQLYDAIEPAEFTALSAANQTLIRDLLNMGMVNLTTGSRARARMTTAFTVGAGPITRAALTALAATYEARTQPWWSASVAAGGGGLTSPVSNHDLVAAGGLT